MKRNGVKETWQDAGARSELVYSARLTSLLVQTLGVVAVRGNARHKLARLGNITSSREAKAMMGGKASMAQGYEMRRIHYANRNGFTPPWTGRRRW